MRAHALNQGFAWKPTRPPLQRLSPEQAGELDRRGFLMLPRALDLDDAVALRTEVDGFPVDLHARSMQYALRIARRSEKIQRLLFSPLVQGLLADLVGPDVWLHYDHSLYKDPRSQSSMLWHQDGAYPYLEPQQRIVFWFALTDASVEDGCLWALPGAHTGGVFAHKCEDDTWSCFAETPPGAVPLPVSIGDLVIYSTVTPHYSGANRGDHTRKAYICQFMAGDCCAVARDAEGKLNRRPISEEEWQLRLREGGRPCR